jgi:hypothetical protein
MIVKVQTPLASNEREPLAMIYNKDRSVEAFVPITADIKKLMKDTPKAFFHAKMNGDKIELLKEAVWQNW